MLSDNSNSSNKKRKAKRGQGFMFKCCKQQALDILNYAYNPQILVADSAPFITKGFKKAFDLLFRIDCWAHTDRNFDQNADKLIDDKEIRLKVKADIDIFQNYVETDSFLDGTFRERLGILQFLK